MSESFRPYLSIPECDKRRKLACKYSPECDKLQRTEHHLRPKRLLKIAREAQMEASYLAKLHKVIHHPFNIIELPRCLHDDFDEFTSDELESEAELDRVLGVWNGQ